MKPRKKTSAAPSSLLIKPMAEVEVRLEGQTLLFQIPKDDLTPAIKEWKRHYSHKTFSKAPTVDTLERLLAEATGSAMDAGGKLRHFRKQAGWTQADLAKRIGSNQGNVAAMENGSRVIGKDIAIELGKIFGLDYRIFL